ncbi:signal recognition particle protein [Mycoplasmopsis californica HAZ160_1]|uniref:Signal recognition particle protein n=1 Tax=Mycoplasmopsis californica HAZ160_1 TaxID=1397850 RepID=A0AAT9F7U9_9BACT|nr:signal recognition particle protein [Mycoplasmopsis californica]BAP00985.1 signal recognition particle protein [Mycoplasmopsis californica HAZ160_1]BBG40849.1 signal recognition particle protein [Mycoplasmopsis californica]BBG41443.1 signal recognition particle protein [Mycoplasmopsis californica]BBG42036.1 signal recognition particle protein [Mycoplasmopsis californica]BBG42620.1 signal recognition particle protein [Mycoplasmopsis californica]
MFNFLENRIQKSIQKMNKKTMINEEDIIEVTRDIKMALLEADVNLKVVKEFVNNVKQKALESRLVGSLNASEQMIKIVHAELQEILGGSVKDIKITHKPFIIMMTGLQGSGKTTASAKIAYYLRKKNYINKPLLVAGDIYRPAAVQQLVTLAKSIQVDYFEKGVATSAQNIVAEALAYANENKNDLIIIDTAGRLSIDDALMNELEDLKRIAHPDEIFFVADALSGQDIINVASTFNEKLNLTASVITKLDSDARGGAALSLAKVLGLPIKFIGTGEKISNLDLFYPDRMADRILGMGDVLSLIEKAEEVYNPDDASNMIAKILKGSFTLDDLMSNLSQIKRLGKMKSILKMIPGLANKISDDKISEAEQKMASYEILISSMTKKERKNPKLLKQASRKARILAGSGRSAFEYNRLINDFEAMSKQMSEMAKKIKSGNLSDLNKMGLGGMF